MSLKRLRPFYRVMRPTQWVKNMAVFAPLIFTAQLFNWPVLQRVFFVFIAFCLLSSSSYILNDLVDAPLDRQHPFKKNRPIAKGEISKPQAIRLLVALLISGLGILTALGPGTLLLGVLFYGLHVFYSFLLKKLVLWDILTIAFSFILRALAGEVATGFHLSIWLNFTVIFLSLLIACGKRRSELVLEGNKTRPVLDKYERELLDFYTSMFAVATLISYSLFTYFIEVKDFGHNLVKTLGPSWSFLGDRKWLMLTLIPVIMGIMRYAYLIYTRNRGEQPEKLLTSDLTLLASVVLWGAMFILIVYAI